jgi:hypothetical protein
VFKFVSQLFQILDIETMLLNEGRLFRAQERWSTRRKGAVEGAPSGAQCLGYYRFLR